MKSSKHLILLLSISCFAIFTVNAQTYINKNRGHNNTTKKKSVKHNTHNTYGSKKVSTKHSTRNTHGSHHVNTHNNQHSSHNGSGKVTIRTNRNNIIRNKPNRPVYVNKPTSNRRGYFWIDGYWRWNIHTYIWVQGFWERERSNFHWHKGSWEATPNGFFWLEGYWCDSLWE